MKREGFQALLSEHTYWKGLMFVSYQIPKGTIIAFTCFCAAPPEVVQRFKLRDPKTFHYLNQSNCYQIDGLNEAKEYIATRNVMDVVGISSKEQDAIYRVVAAILHLGNIEFAKGEEIDSSKT